jgi:hypothetical protein
MTTQTLIVSSKTSVSVTGFNSLANVTYCISDVIDFTSVDPLDAALEVYTSPGTVSGNKQLLVFAKTSLDNSAWTTGPESGTSTTDQPNLMPIGAIPCNSNSVSQRRHFPLQAILGWVPPYVKVVFFNDTGAALQSTNNLLWQATITGNSA